MGEPLAAPAIVNKALDSPGHSLDVQTRAFLEPRFGRDLSRIRVHTDSHAAESARALNALAYTVRNDIVFGAEQYSPHNRRGRGLLAHEVSHVVQQSSLIHPVVQYQKPDTGPRDVRPDPIDDVLPRGVGLLAGLDRRFLLIDIFGERQLEEIVSEIKSDPSALAFTRKTGILGFLALVDTRQGKRFNVPQAQAVLDANEKKPKPARRYQRLLLEPRSEAAKSFWFQPKPPEERPTGKDIAEIPTLDEEGRAIGKSSKKKALESALIGSAVGGILGGAMGGAKGAAVGAGAGAGAGLLFAIKFTTSGSQMEFAPGSIFTLDVSDRR